MTTGSMCVRLSGDVMERPAHGMDEVALVIETGFLEEQDRIMQVRNAVFVQEQGVPAELEQDAKDPVCRHALLLFVSEVPDRSPP